jgi:2,5-diamino-6-(ribosylamino)-4(3H)-pyrimidinone 5'-phosphate reductase
MNRPKLIVHNLASVDGRLTLAADVLLLYGDPRWQAVAGSSEGVYRQIMSTYQPRALLEGSGSFVLPGQLPEKLPVCEGDTSYLYDDYLPEAVLNYPGGRKWLVVVDSRGRVRWMYKEFPGEEWVGWHIMVLVARATPPEYLAYLQNEKIPYLVNGQDRVDLSAALARLYDRLGVTCVVSTAGGSLNGALLRAGLVNEISVEFFPALIGGKDTPALFDSPALKPDELPTRLELLESQVKPKGNVWLHYRVLRDS